MLISMIGIEPSDGSEDSIDPKLLSLTMYSCGGSSLLMDISSTLLDNSAEGRTMLSVTYTVSMVVQLYKAIGIGANLVSWANISKVGLH